MINKASFFLILFTSLSFYGQNSRFDNSNSAFLYYTSPDTKQANIEGSAYVDSKFLPSQVSGITTATPALRYNAYKDELEFVEAGKTYYVTKKDSLEVKLLSKTYKCLEYPIEKGEEKGYLVVLSSEPNQKFSVYKKERVTLVPEYDSGSGYRDAVPAHYKLEEDKFYMGVSNKIDFLPKKEKDIIALVPEHAAELKQFMKENKISLKSEESLKQLVKYMNTLK